MFKRALFFLAAFVLVISPAQAEGEAQRLQFSPEHRVLVVAPHPDDESLGLGGVLQWAKDAGAAVRVVYLTNGELNEVSSLFYRKRPLISRSDFIKSGMTRQAEAVAAMAQIGIPAEDLVFLGYPDGGLMSIWLKYWRDSKPYRSIFTRISKVPFPGPTSGHEYKGDEVLRDLGKVLSDLKPTHVFVTAAFDLNSDHQASYLFSQSALLDLETKEGIRPDVDLYVVHAHRWPLSKPGRDGKAPSLPRIEAVQMEWESYPLTPEQVEKKKSMILEHKSQVAYKKDFLLSFARPSENFAELDVPKLARETVAQDTPSLLASFPKDSVSYRVLGNELWISVPMDASVDESGAIHAYVFGYSRNTPFGEMPKLCFKLFGNKLFLYDRFRAVLGQRALYTIDKEKLLIRVPLAMLKDPDHLFVSTRKAKKGTSLDFGAWKMLEMV